MQTAESTVIETIQALDLSPLITETAIGLTLGWIQRFAPIDSAQTSLLVEAPFLFEIDPHALLVGIADRIAWSEEAQTVFGCTWKTTREPTGRFNERSWLLEQRRSPQWKFESLALKDGLWATPHGLGKFTDLLTCPPFILRGAVKSAIPDFWPTEPKDGILECTVEEFDGAKAALVARAAAIRAMRLQGDAALPWQLPGMHCFVYNQACEFLASCESGETTLPPYEGVPNAHDKRIRETVTRFYPDFGTDPLDIVMTPTNYMLGSNCIERWRRRLTHPTESSPAQLIGTAFHVGVAAWYEKELPTTEDLIPWLTIQDRL